MGLVQFKLDGGKMPSQGYPTDSGWDLYTSETATIPPHSFVDIPTGVSMSMPFRIWALLTGRSSAGRKFGIRIEQGVIDNEYTGELFVGVWNLYDKPIEIKANTRLAQLIFFEVMPIIPQQVDKLPETRRGSNGFGSTGTK